MGCSHSNIFPNSDTNKTMTIDTDVLRNNTNLNFDTDDVTVIQLVWLQIDNQMQLGIEIMTRLIYSHPELKQIWIFASSLETEEEILSNSQVVYHSGKIIQVINKIVSNLNNLDPKELKYLINLGRNHYNYGVKPQFFNLFEESMMYCMEKRITNKQIFNMRAKNLWRKMYWAIVGNLCHGIYLAECEDKEKLK